MAVVTTSAEGSDAPAPGQLVTVRNRIWVASDVVKGNVAAGTAVTMTGRPPHVVTLVSIEDDARDEQLRVVWELERSAVAHDQHAFRTRPMASTIRASSTRSWTPCGGELSLQRIRPFCRPRSVPVSRSRITSSIRWFGRCLCRGPTC